MISKILDFVVGREPVETAGVVTALIGLGVAFGLNLTPEQTVAIAGAVGVVLAWFARSAVTPVNKPPVAVPDNMPGVPK